MKEVTQSPPSISDYVIGRDANMLAAQPYALSKYLPTSMRSPRIELVSYHLAIGSYLHENGLSEPKVHLVIA
jgi:hypothetical protein